MVSNVIVRVSFLMSWRLKKHTLKKIKKTHALCQNTHKTQPLYIKHTAHALPTQMSSYVEFYRGTRFTIIDPVGIYYLINGATDVELERHHGYIQWVFPLKEVSKSQPHSIDEVLTDEAIAELLGDPEIEKRIRRITRRMLRFWGIRYDKDGAAIENMDVFRAKLGCRSNHNQLRMTRMLTFLRHLGWDADVDEIKPLLLNNTPKNSAAVRYWASV